MNMRYKETWKST